jgi:hypothetical protein
LHILLPATGRLPVCPFTRPLTGLLTGIRFRGDKNHPWISKAECSFLKRDYQKAVSSKQKK